MLVPSRLPADAGAWVSDFASRIRDEVAGPLFGAPDVATFEDVLDEALATGAALRMRWLTQLAELPSEEAEAELNAWLRPPPPTALRELERHAAGLLGPERSFLVRRALELTLTDTAEASSAMLERWRLPGGDPKARLVELVQVAEAAAPQDVLGLVWMMALLGDVPLPSREVAEAAESALLRATAERLRVLGAVLRGEIASPAVSIDDHELPIAWMEQHPALVSPLLLLAGLGLDERGCRLVVVLAHPDPEEEGGSSAEVRVLTAGDPDEMLSRIEERALRMGVLGVQSDRHGGWIALTTEAVRP